MGPRLVWNVPKQGTLRIVAGELDIEREMCTQQAERSTDPSWAGIHSGKPLNHPTGAATGATVAGSVGNAMSIAVCISKALRGMQSRHLHQASREENHHQIEPEPTKSHPSQPSPHSLRFELIVSALDIRAGRASARSGTQHAGARRSKAKGSSSIEREDSSSAHRSIRPLDTAAPPELTPTPVRA